MTRARPSARRSERARPPLLALALGAGLLVVAAVGVWTVATRTGRPAFDGERALALVEEQVGFGPRIPGTEGHARQLAWMETTLRPLADAVNGQPVEWTDAKDSTRVWRGTNLVASFNLDPPGGQRVMLAAHWDTRPFADADPDSANHARPVPGANDGGSGVAVLLEMARILSEHPPSVGVDLVFFDLEDLGDNQPDSTRPANPFAIGSRQFVRDNAGYRPAWGVLLDMVCDRNLAIPREAYSQANARPIVDRVWAAAARVGATAFKDRTGVAVEDDHVAFLQAGIPVIDLIHAPFPPTWHTLADTPAACSAASLQQVGDVLVEVLYGEEE